MSGDGNNHPDDERTETSPDYLTGMREGAKIDSRESSELLSTAVGSYRRP